MSRAAKDAPGCPVPSIQDAQEFLFFLFDRLETELQPQAEAEGGGARLARKASQSVPKCSTPIVSAYVVPGDAASAGGIVCPPQGTTRVGSQMRSAACLRGAW